MPSRSFYFPPNFDHVESILQDNHEADLNKIFATFRSNRLPPLVDSGSVAQVLGLSSRLIFSIIRNKGKHYRRFKIKKSGGGTRDIASPRTYLKVIQWWVLDNIFRGQKFPDNVMGFVRGRGVHSNAQFHLGADHILNMDLKDFFPSIKIDKVKSIFHSLGYNSIVAEQLSEICTLGDCLPQGAPTSPSLANLTAFDLDHSLTDLAESSGLKYTRYADDLTFSSKFKISEDFKLAVAAKINRRGFSVNERKTRFRGQGGRMEVTGVVINAHAQPPRQWRNKVRMIFFQATKFPMNFCDRLDELNGYLGSVKAYVPDGEQNKLLKSGHEAILAVKSVS
jgi:RNA-directed DNA polymerase